MFTRIMAPVDLRHPDDLAPALELAASLAQQHGAEIVYVGVASSAPGQLGHNPDEFADRLDDFARAEADRRGVKTSGHAVLSHDPAIDLNEKLVAAVKELGADLVVMQTHRPSWADHWFAAHGATVARDAPASVFLVRKG